MGLTAAKRKWWRKVKKNIEREERAEMMRRLGQRSEYIGYSYCRDCGEEVLRTPDEIYLMVDALSHSCRMKKVIEYQTSRDRQKFLQKMGIKEKTTQERLMEMRDAHRARTHGRT